MQLDDSLPDGSLLALGLAYLAEWNISAAQSEIARTIQLNPSMADVYHLRARVETALNRNAEAIQAQRTAMELDPFERPWGMVWTLKTVRQYDAAIQEAQQRLEALPHDDSIYWELGRVYDRKGDKDKAVQAWEKMELAEEVTLLTQRIFVMCTSAEVGPLSSNHSSLTMKKRLPVPMSHLSISLGTTPNWTSARRPCSCWRKRLASGLRSCSGYRPTRPSTSFTRTPATKLLSSSLGSLSLANRRI